MGLDQNLTRTPLRFTILRCLPTLLEEEVKVIPAIQQVLARVVEPDRQLLAQQALLQRCHLQVERDATAELRCRGPPRLSCERTHCRCTARDPALRGSRRRRRRGRCPIAAEPAIAAVALGARRLLASRGRSGPSSGNVPATSSDIRASRCPLDRFAVP